MGKQTPGEFEQVVLVTLGGFDREVAGREVYEVIVESTGRDISVAAVHITLSRLAEKSWVTCSTTAPAPGEGGKPRRHYTLAPRGARALREQREQLSRLWDLAEQHPLLSGDG